MENKTIKIQANILFGLIVANFIAQIPYDLDLYAGRSSFFIQMRSLLILLILLAILVFAFLRLLKKTRLGYWLMLAFLAVEFLFYLGNVLFEAFWGGGLFHHLFSPDPVISIVFAVGYINLFASGYFLCLLLFQRSDFLSGQIREKPLTQTPA